LEILALIAFGLTAKLQNSVVYPRRENNH